MRPSQCGVLILARSNRLGRCPSAENQSDSVITRQCREWWTFAWLRKFVSDRLVCCAIGGVFLITPKIIPKYDLICLFAKGRFFCGSSRLLMVRAF